MHSVMLMCKNWPGDKPYRREDKFCESFFLKLIL